MELEIRCGLAPRERLGRASLAAEGGTTATGEPVGAALTCALHGGGGDGPACKCSLAAAVLDLRSASRRDCVAAAQVYAQWDAARGLWRAVGLPPDAARASPWMLVLRPLRTAAPGGCPLSPISGIPWAERDPLLRRAGAALDAVSRDDPGTLAAVLAAFPAAVALRGDAFQTPLHLAIRAGTMRCAAVLWERGAAPDAVDAWGVTPVALVLRASLAVRAQGEQRAVAPQGVVAEALRVARAEVAQWACGPPPPSADAASAAIVEAAAAHRTAMLASVARSPAVMEAPLFHAATRGDFPTLCGLALIGASLGARDAAGRTLLHAVAAGAARHGDHVTASHVACTLFLVEYGDGLEGAADAGGRTALHVAAAGGADAVALALVSSGSEAARCDADGATPRRLARVAHRPALGKVRETRQRVEGWAHLSPALAPGAGAVREGGARCTCTAAGASAGSVVRVHRAVCGPERAVGGCDPVTTRAGGCNTRCAGRASGHALR